MSSPEGIAALLAAPGASAVAPATGVGSLAWLLFVLPGLGALVLFVLGRKANAWGHLLGCATPVAAFLVHLAALFCFGELGLREPGAKSPMISTVLSADYAGATPYS